MVLNFTHRMGKSANPSMYSSPQKANLSWNLKAQKLKFEKTREKQYHTIIYPNSTGFHDLSGYTVAVNERSEYRNTGNNDFDPRFLLCIYGFRSAEV